MDGGWETNKSFVEMDFDARVFPHSSFLSETTRYRGRSSASPSYTNSSKQGTNDVYYRMRIVVQSRPYIQEEMSEGSSLVLFG